MASILLFCGRVSLIDEESDLDEMCGLIEKSVADTLRRVDVGPEPAPAVCYAVECAARDPRSQSRRSALVVVLDLLRRAAFEGVCVLSRNRIRQGLVDVDLGTAAGPAQRPSRTL